MAKAIQEQLSGCFPAYLFRHSVSYRHKAFLQSVPLPHLPRPEPLHNLTSNARFFLFQLQNFRVDSTGSGIHRHGRAQGSRYPEPSGDWRSCLWSGSPATLRGESLAPDGESRCGQTGKLSRQHVLRARASGEKIAVGGISAGEWSGAGASDLSEVEALSF